MKKIISSGFVLFFSLYLIGYYGVLLFMEQQYAHQLEARIDNHLDELSGSLIIKVPLSLPYANSSVVYERTDGVIKVHDENYRAIKQRLYRDTLYVVCIKDRKDQKMKGVMDDFVSALAGTSGSTPLAMKIPNLLNKDYLPHQNDLVASHSGWSRLLEHHFPDPVYFSSTHTSLFRPPRG